MKRRKLKNWAGEDWTVEAVVPDDTRLPENSHACIRDSKKEILVSEAPDASMIYWLLHEVAHHALKHLEFSDSEKEELLMDRVALVYAQFLEKMGVDLSPLARLKG